MGASSNIVGRLLTYEEALSLKNAGLNFYLSSCYWLGSIKTSTQVWYVKNSSGFDDYSYTSDKRAGVRPVIAVNTSDII